MSKVCIAAENTMAFRGSVAAAAVWPAVNLGLFVPIVVTAPVLVYQLACQVGTTAAGNVDVGIYDEEGNRLVSAGVTAIAAAGVQVFDVTDTWIPPSAVYLAMWCSTVTTATFQRGAGSIQLHRSSGIQSQASLASGLPTTVTLAGTTTAYMPLIVANFMTSTF